jgi:hypothetical protein
MGVWYETPIFEYIRCFDITVFPNSDGLSVPLAQLSYHCILDSAVTLLFGRYLFGCKILFS